MTHRQVFKELSKLEPPSSSRKSREETCVLARWQSVFRRHELNAGFGAERENLALDAKGLLSSLRVYRSSFPPASPLAW
jgi:hypothetical protein